FRYLPRDPGIGAIERRRRCGSLCGNRNRGCRARRNRQNHSRPTKHVFLRPNVPIIIFAGWKAERDVKMPDAVKKVVLAYSGGLDTSVILRWLQETYRC